MRAGSKLLGATLLAVGLVAQGAHFSTAYAQSAAPAPSAPVMSTEVAAPVSTPEALPSGAPRGGESKAGASQPVSVQTTAAGGAHSHPSVLGLSPVWTTGTMVTGIIALAALAGGAAFGGVSLSERAAFERNPTTAAADTAERDGLRADMCFGLALTLGITTAIMVLTSGAPAKTVTAGGRNLQVSF